MLRERKVNHHHYSLQEMTISVKQVIIGCNSYKGVQKNRQIEITEGIETARREIVAKSVSQLNKAPNYNTIRQWVGRIGLYELPRNKEIRVERTWIIDLSLELGTRKCLVILGISQQYLSDKVWGEKTILYLKEEKKRKRPTETEKLEIKRLKSKLAWLLKYETAIKTWHLMLRMSRGIETKLKKEGLHQKSLLEFKQTVPKFSFNSQVDNLREGIIRYLEEQSTLVEGKNPILASSDVIESILGKYKFFSKKGPLKEIRRIIFLIPLLTIKITRDFIQEGLEKIKNLELKKWEEEIFGQSILSKRRILFARKSAGII